VDVHGDFSRWTFDRGAGYRSVLLQQGRVLLDADFNEQAAITAHHDETRMLDVAGRAGGPADGAGFALVDAAGAAPDGTAWEDLHVTPGRFYVDGVLAEAAATEEGPGHPLAAQPHLRGNDEQPGLDEPEADGRYAAVLDVFTHHVTADEAPQLLESALGGPDTATRGQTVWQVTLRAVDPDETCAAARDAAAEPRTPPTLTASLADVAEVSDPCEITTANGYRRLENQLYRVQIHEVDPGSGEATYLWSRENGSVVAGLDAIGPTAVAAMDAELTLDREGRDEELSIGEGDVVEVTSTDRALHGLPGFLATAGAPEGLLLPVAWAAGAPDDLAALGRAPVVRRWEGEPRPAGGGEDPLEDGIQVAFGEGEFRTGDHWLIPARTVRLVYGATALSGTIEWPVDETGAPLPQPPLGPEHHRTTIALLDRATADGAGAWTLRADCRRLFPPLTELVTIDLLGGDGQEALAGQPLPEVVRVAVRNGGLAVPGATVRFAAAGGHLDTAPPTSSDPATLDVACDARGHAEVRWLLNAGGPGTQVLTATLLDDASAPVGAEVHVTGRLREPRERTPGMHVEAAITLIDDDKLENDTIVDPGRLLEGLGIVLDDLPDPAWVKDKPVLRVALDLPWPADDAERALWGAAAAGTQRIDLRGIVSADERVVIWRPVDEAVKFLQRVVPLAAQFGMERVLAHVALLGNVVASGRDKRLFVNGRAFGALRPDGTTALALPSVDDVHGADFTMWFWLAVRKDEKPPRIVVRPERLVFGTLTETRPLTVTNSGGSPLVVDAEARTISPPGTAIYQVEPPGREVPPGASAEFAVTSMRGGPAAVFAGELVLTSNDPQQPRVSVPLSSPGRGDFGIVPTRTGILRLAPVRNALVALAGPDAEPGAAGTRPLVNALADRTDHPRLRLALAEGFGAAAEELRARLARADLEAEIVDGDPAELVKRAAADDDLVLDGVVGDEPVAKALADAVGRAVLPLVAL
jgi:hypothetical protein